MKTASPDLFELIKSLTPSEKAYFRKFAGLHAAEGSHVYDKMFEVILAQSVYDDDALRKQFKGQTAAKHLHKVKNYLMQLILRSLASYHRTSNQTFIIEGGLLQIRALFHKGLYSLCAKQVKYYKKIASDCQEDIALEQLILWELRLLAVRGFATVKVERIEKLHDELSEVMNAITSFHAYMREQLKAFHAHYTRGYSRKIGETRHLDGIMASELFRSKKAPKGFWAEQCYLNILELYYGERQNYRESLKASRKRKALFERFPKVAVSTDDRFYSYLQVIYNVIEAQYHLRKFDEMVATIHSVQKLSEHPYVSKVELLQATVFFIATKWEILLYNQTGRFKEGQKLVKLIDEGLEEHRAFIGPRERVTLLHAAAVNAFGAKNYDSAIRYLTEIINNPAFTEYESFYSMAIMLRIIVHYELGTYDILPSLLRSANRYLSKLDRLYKLEAAILRFIRKQIGSGRLGEEPVAAIKREIESLDAIDRRELETFDLASWIQSKISKKEFDKVLSEKR